MPNSRIKLDGCPAECQGCGEVASSPVAAAGPLVGSSLAAHSLLTFVLPLILALVGAIWADAGPVSQLSGGVAGLFVGMLVVRAYVILRTRFRRGET